MECNAWLVGRLVVTMKSQLAHTVGIGEISSIFFLALCVCTKGRRLGETNPKELAKEQHRRSLGEAEFEAAWQFGQQTLEEINAKIDSAEDSIGMPMMTVYVKDATGGVAAVVVRPDQE